MPNFEPMSADPGDLPRPLRLPQVEPVRLYRQIANLISEHIDRGLFPVGSLLPAERDLAQQLGVSRTSVREALIALEVSGKVSIRVGHGVQILQAIPRSDRVGARADLGEADIGPIQLMQARRHVETKTAELAAANRTKKNLERLEQALQVQARARTVDAPEYRNGDRDFHVEIARASGNAAFTLIIADLWDCVCKPTFAKPSTGASLTPSPPGTAWPREGPCARTLTPFCVRFPEVSRATEAGFRSALRWETVVTCRA